MVTRLRASGLPSDDLLLRLQKLSPTLGFAAGNPEWARAWLSDPFSQDALLVQQCVVRMLFAVRAMAEARAAELDDAVGTERFSTGQKGIRRWQRSRRPTVICSTRRPSPTWPPSARDGAPQVTPVWIDHDGHHIRFNTARGRVKDKNLERNPKIALSIQDPENPYRYIQVRGRVVEVTEKGADEHIDALAKKYLGQDRYPLPASRRGARHGEGDCPRRSRAWGSLGLGDPARRRLQRFRAVTVLFRDVDWDIGDRERIGLVGPNGAGKTTLCRILAGVDEPGHGAGEPAAQRDRRLPAPGSGRQRQRLRAGRGAQRLRRGVGARARDGRRRPRRWRPTPDDALTERYGELQHRFDALGGYRLESQARAILSGLGFRADELRAAADRILRRLAHAGVAGPPAAAGPVAPAARRADQPPRSRLAGLAREFPERATTARWSSSPTTATS